MTLAIKWQYWASIYCDPVSASQLDGETLRSYRLDEPLFSLRRLGARILCKAPTEVV